MPYYCRIWDIFNRYFNLLFRYDFYFYLYIKKINYDHLHIFLEPRVENLQGKSDVSRAEKHHLREILKLDQKNQEFSVQMDEYEDV